MYKPMDLAATNVWDSVWMQCGNEHRDRNTRVAHYHFFLKKPPINMPAAKKKNKKKTAHKKEWHNMLGGAGCDSQWASKSL